jgi:hypothetical protein
MVAIVDLKRHIRIKDSVEALSLQATLLTMNLNLATIPKRIKLKLTPTLTTNRNQMTKVRKEVF